MSQETTLLLVYALPEFAFKTLKSEVAARQSWRLMSPSDTDQPRFIIEKEVKYWLINYLSLDARYQVVGRFEKTRTGDTALYYSVVGQPWIPFFHAAVYVIAMLAFTLLFALAFFSPPMVVNLVSYLLVGGLLGATVLYAMYAYCRYHWHIREMHRFMEEFALTLAAKTKRNSSTASEYFY